MDARARGAIQGVAFLVGLGLAFFLVAAPLFEGTARVLHPERLVSYGLVAAAYFLAALAAARLTGMGPYRWLVWLDAPAIALIALLTADGGLPRLALHVVYAAVVVGATLAGAAAGLWWGRSSNASDTAM